MCANGCRISTRPTTTATAPPRILQDRLPAEAAEDREAGHRQAHNRVALLHEVAPKEEVEEEDAADEAAADSFL
jgi:hypothetical protein